MLQPEELPMDLLTLPVEWEQAVDYDHEADPKHLACMTTHCPNVPIDPANFNCKYLMCRPCLERTIVASSQPTGHSLGEHPPSYKVRCVHDCDKEPVTPAVARKENHRAACCFNDILFRCGNEGCEEKYTLGPRGQRELDHRKVCPFRKVACKFCRRVVPLPDFTKHIETCPRRTMPCKDCGEMVTHASRVMHMRGGVRCVNMRRCENRCVTSTCGKRQPTASAVKKALLHANTEPKMDACKDHVCVVTPVYVPMSRMATHLAQECPRRKMTCPGRCGENVCFYLLEAHLARTDLVGKHMLGLAAKIAMPSLPPPRTAPAAAASTGLCVMDAMKCIPTGMGNGHEYTWKQGNWLSVEVKIKGNEWTIQVELDAANPQCKKAKWSVFVGLCQRLAEGEATQEGNAAPGLSRTKLSPTITTEFYTPSMFNGGKEFGKIDIPLWRNCALSRESCTNTAGACAIVIKVHRFEA